MGYFFLDHRTDGESMELSRLLGNFHHELDQRGEKFEEWNEIGVVLKDLASLFKAEEYRYQLTAGFLDDIMKLLFTFHSALHDGKQDVSVGCYDIIAEAFRCVRNGCANSAENQTKMIAKEEIVHYTRDILRVFLQKPQKEAMILLRCGIQFLGNLSVNNRASQEVVWKYCVDDFQLLLSTQDATLSHYSCMVVHNCLRGLTVKDPSFAGSCQEFAAPLQNLVLSVLNMLLAEDSEWGFYVIEDFLVFENFLSSLNTKLTDKQKIMVLDIMINVLQNLDENKDSAQRLISEKNLLVIATEYTGGAHSLLSTSWQDPKEILSLVILKQLEVLCLATAQHGIYPGLQANRELLVCCVDLLQSIHNIEKENGDNFSTKVTRQEKVDPQHPTYGLKRDLIRLIGNLVYRNGTNQDKVREIDGIPLILSQTNIDDRNPFIMQWSILAIRNLCEGNPQNRSYIASLKIEGVANSVALMDDFGIEANIKEGKVVIKGAKCEESL